MLQQRCFDKNVSLNHLGACLAKKSIDIIRLIKHQKGKYKGCIQKVLQVSYSIVGNILVLLFVILLTLQIVLKLDINR